MSSPDVFEWTSQALDEATSLERVEARGTLRLSLKSSGLEAKKVNAAQMKTLLIRVLPGEFEARGISEADGVCDRLVRQLASQRIGQAVDADSPENLFARLAGE